MIHRGGDGGGKESMLRGYNREKKICRVIFADMCKRANERVNARATMCLFKQGTQASPDEYYFSLPLPLPLSFHTDTCSFVVSVCNIWFAVDTFKKRDKKADLNM